MTFSLPLLGALFFASGALTVAGVCICQALANRGISVNDALSIFDDEEPVNKPTDILFQPQLKKADPIQ